jgi:hypothetical protein
LVDGERSLAVIQPALLRDSVVCRSPRRRRLITFWALGPTAGAAFIIRPELGAAIRPSDGDSPEDFVTAMLVAGA